MSNIDRPTCETRETAKSIMDNTDAFLKEIFSVTCQLTDAINGKRESPINEESFQKGAQDYSMLDTLRRQRALMEILLQCLTEVRDALY